VARLALTPTALTKTASALNITDLIATGTLGTNTGVSFANSGREFLAVTVAAGSSTCSVNIGTTVEGAQPPALTPTIPASKTSLLGPFPFDENQTGASAGQIFVDFGTPANVTVALLQFVGVS
jgi:hypothetical protein